MRAHLVIQNFDVLKEACELRVILDLNQKQAILKHELQAIIFSGIFTAAFFTRAQLQQRSDMGFLPLRTIFKTMLYNFYITYVT